MGTMSIEDLCGVATEPATGTLEPLRIVRPAPTVLAHGRLPSISEIASPVLKSEPSPLAVLIRIPFLGRVKRASEPTVNFISMDEDQTPAPCIGEKRKRTAEQRREETVKLLDELQHLEAKLKQLKRESGQSESDDASKNQPLESACHQGKLYLASLRCLFSQSINASMDTAAPVHSYIHLGKSFEHRRRAILDLKPKQLHLGRQFIDECSKHLNITQPFTSSEWHMNDDGDAYGVHFCVGQLHDVHSVHGVFSVAVAYVSNYEASVKKAVSIVTYHEENLAPAVSSNSQLRLVMSPDGGPVVETNTLIFSSYDPDQSTGIVVANYVDRDDLRPYVPVHRVRQELTGVMVISPSPVGVVVRHWLYLRTVNAPHLVDANEFAQYARENEGHKVEELLAYIREKTQAKSRPPGAVLDYAADYSNPRQQLQSMAEGNPVVSAATAAPDAAAHTAGSQLHSQSLPAPQIRPSTEPNEPRYKAKRVASSDPETVAIGAKLSVDSSGERRNQPADDDRDALDEDYASALPSVSPRMRFADLLRSAQAAPSPSPSLQTNVPPPQAEDGSAQALLSLMESVRSHKLTMTGHGLLAATTGVSPAPAAVAPPEPTSRPREQDQAESSGASSDGGADTLKGRRPYKKRKSTHTVRKEEKATLMDEIKSLEDQLTFLRGQVFAPVRDSEGQIVKPGVSNAVLRQAIHEQQLRFASARSLLSQSLTSELAAPLHTYLHLGRDMAERRAVLLALKQASLETGKRYIEERSRLLDLSKHHAVVERFETVSGDACCIRFYVDQFPSALTSVKNVHDATSFFTSNLEMSITDSLGHITIREDDDSGDPSLAQHRLVVAGTQGVVVDVNSVVFSHYNEQENYGLLATTYVDQDDLHPYRPLERIRQDVTAVSLITQENDVVVVRRWAYICMRHSDHVVFPYGALQTIRENLGIWGDAMTQFVRERLRMKAQAMATS